MVLEYKVSVSESHKGTLYSTTSNLCVILHIFIYTKLKKNLIDIFIFQRGNSGTIIPVFFHVTIDLLIWN